MEDLEKLLHASRPRLCEKCLGRMVYVDEGVYRCELCGNEVLDALGKIKHYIERNGAVPISDIARDTDVSEELIDLCLKNGRLELPTEHFTIKCARCGCGIHSGRFCQKCKKELAGGIQAMFDNH